MVDAYIPEKRSAFSKFASLFDQGSKMIGQGKEAWSSGKGIWEKFTGGGSTGATGTGAGGGGGGAAAAAPAAAAPAAEAGGALETIGTYAPYAAPAVAAVGTYQDYKETGGQNVGPIGTSPRAQQAKWSMAENTLKAGRDINAEANRFASNIGLGLTDQKTPSMDAIERRLSSQQTAQRDIDEARSALDVAGLPPDERRSIAQKLDRARQQLIGGRKRGSTIYS